VLTIRRGADGKPRQYTLVRGWIRVAPVSHKVLPAGVAYVAVQSFSRRVAADIEKILTDHPPTAGVVLDLRNNPGGLFDEAVELCDLFLKGGPVVSAVGRDGRVLESREARERTLIADLPVAVLVDGGSASAAEIVAGALRDRERARLFGEKTYGKGSVQSMLNLSDGSGLKLTVARYFTPSGKQIDGKGIAPDEVVKTPEPTADDAAVEAALRWIGKQSK